MMEGKSLYCLLNDAMSLPPQLIKLILLVVQMPPLIPISATQLMLLVPEPYSSPLTAM